MLTWFRDNAKIFLVTVVVIFVGMIFLEWGAGGAQNVSPDQMTVGTVNGKGLQPSSYDAAREEVYSGMERQMTGMGYPNSESQLALMYNDINDAAFDLLVNRSLQNEYLKRLGWDTVDMSMAEPLLKAQLGLMGIQDPDGYIEEYRNDPNFDMTLYQIAVQADMAMFNSSASLQNMISADEIEFLIRDAMTSVTARYIPFRASPPMPSPEELEVFYNQNTDLFTRAEGSRIRFAVYMIQPAEQDLETSLAMVDSLAVTGGGIPDTMRIVRSQLAAIVGWNIDLEQGSISEPFTAASMMHAGIQACHSIELLSVSRTDADTTGPSDTLTIVHWEVPLFPGRQTVREAFWDLEEHAEEILASDVPEYEDYQLVDFGEYIIDTETIPTAELPQALISFATDSIWVDSIGPVLYIPSFSGSYPALLVARKLEHISGGMTDFDTALESNSILLAYYIRAQNEDSNALALEALDGLRASGMSLSEWANAESLEVYDTQQFTPASVRQWAQSDESAYRGILGCSGFADASLTAPEYTIIGPFTSNGVTYLAEIIGRTETQIPQERAQLSGFYLSMQAGYNSLYTARLMESIRNSSDIVDNRTSYYAAMDSLRADYAARQQQEDSQ